MAEQLTYPEALEQLRKAYEREKIQLTAKISTLEVTISQLQGELNRLNGIGSLVDKTPESYCVQCLVDFGDASLGCNVLIVEPSDECISCQAMEDSPEP